ncbi:heterokaryon incompatibility [Aspergillus sergii]|uniref:Heterokaryon incompatibility n=1 Tax=Aspergillus sergii TaxID=1034303 RepID=A0A5N6XCQ8_9EURO|nr:heterokaryon incompatibility [Aspergillus sergii]
MQRIPIETLPQTLLDAVLVCRALGVRYLWVYVLCIIQGDKVDWERESATMANVYSHSFLTVCAAQGDSCQSGFLKRHPPSQVEISFHSSLDPSVAGKYSLRKVPGLQHSRDFLESGPPKHPFAVDVGYSSWNSRGWTFQEVKIESSGSHLWHIHDLPMCRQHL